MILVGNPLKGKELEKLKLFLEEMDLEYDEGIEHTYCILDEYYNIIGTGSVEENVLKCIAVDQSYQGQGLMATIVTNLIEYEFQQGRYHLFLFTKPQKKEMFRDLGFYTIYETESVLFMENKRNGFSTYINELKLETPSEAMSIDKKIGTVVANCNPITLGHLHLFQKASLECDYVHVFILSDRRAQIPAQDRYELVKQVVKDIPNIILHKASDYIVSAATFPSYFIKDKVNAEKINCLLDLNLFGERIAPELHIRQRFIGTEPYCKVTNYYNECMKKIMPEYGILVTEIIRKNRRSEPISASRVRKLCELNKIDELATLVPYETLQYLMKDR